MPCRSSRSTRIPDFPSSNTTKSDKIALAYLEGLAQGAHIANVRYEQLVLVSTTVSEEYDGTEDGLCTAIDELRLLLKELEA